MTRFRITNEYFNWLTDLMCKERFAPDVSYSRLLEKLHDTVFRYSIPKDQNRAEDGTDLRYRFAITNGYEDVYDMVLDILDGPCSVFEMMVALAIRCEEAIMDSPDMGDRTGQWFWKMIVSLGLGSMNDDHFDEIFVEEALDRFLDREYEPNGIGGLFTIRNCDRDLREVEIWYQLCWYLDNIT